MRVKLEMDYNTFQLIRGAMLDASTNGTVVINNYGHNLSEFVRTQLEKSNTQLNVARELSFQSYLDGI